MRLFRFLFRASPGRLATAIAVGLLSAVSSAGLIAVINAFLSGQEDSLNLLGGLLAALCAVVLAGEIVSQTLLVGLGQGAVYEMRLRLCRQVLAAPLRRLEEIGAHRLTAVLADDINVIAGVVLVIHMICISAAIVVACLIYLAWLSWPVLLGVMALMALGIASYQLLAAGARRSLVTAREEKDVLFKHLEAVSKGHKELKLHRPRRSAFLNRLLTGSAAAYRRHNTHGMNIYVIAASWGRLLLFVMIGLLLFVLPQFAEVSRAVLTGYVLTILYMIGPLENILNSAPVISRGTVALDKIDSLGLSPEGEEGQGEEPPLPRQPDWRRLELSSVVHSYSGENGAGNFTLGPVDLSLHPGEVVFLTGGNGSGKTTLAKVLTGLYVPEDGQITLDGRPVTDDNREDYRQNFSAVFSDFYLFSQLIGLESPNLDQRARRFLAELRLDQDVSIDNGALSTTQLSQGQRKRLALLTAYLEDRPIYVFDEWAADQDPCFKEVFYRQMLPELKSRGKAVLVISHDDRYYGQADRLVKLDYGQIASRPGVVEASVPAG